MDIDAEADDKAANESKGDAQYVAALNDFFQRFRLQKPEVRRDILDGRYQIQLNTPLPELDNKTARAYAVTDSINNGKPLFALVCNANTTQRYSAIQTLKTITHPNIMKLLAAGWAPMSQPAEDRFVIIYERPVGKKLSELIATRGGITNQDFLLNNFIAPLAAAIQQFEQAGISHGSINPNNIYFQDTPILGDCVSMPCGYDQPFCYEPLERMQALPAGKGEGSVAQDYYAMAVATLFVMYGPGHFADMTPLSLPSAIMRETAAAVLTRNKDFSEVFQDFFRGLLSQNTEDRWNHANIKSWLDGKRFNVLSPTPSAAARPFEFGDKQANSKRELAHVLASDWEHIGNAIDKGQIAQWINISLRGKELSEIIMRYCKTAAELGKKHEAQYNEQIMRILLLLDSVGPIRIGALSMHPDGIATLCAELFRNKSEKELALLAKFIEYNMISFWLDLQRKNPAYAIPNSVNAILMKLDKLKLSIRNTSLGFGLERMLYELNPEMPCQSPLFAGQPVATIPALLLQLDQMAPMLHGNHDPMDRHIAAFITCKIAMQHELKLHELSAVPSLAMNRAVIALKLLAIAQQKTDNLRLLGLTHWLALRIAPAMGTLRSRSLRRRVYTSLVEAAQSGSLQTLAAIVIDPTYAEADQNGFSQAWHLYQLNALKIVGYRKGTNIDQASEQLGYFLSKMFAFAALAITLFSVLR